MNRSPKTFITEKKFNNLKTYYDKKELKTKEKLKYYRDLKKHMKGCLNSKEKKNSEIEVIRENKIVRIKP